MIYGKNSPRSLTYGAVIPGLVQNEKTELETISDIADACEKIAARTDRQQACAAAKSLAAHGALRVG
jgi:hypothetical protein